MSQKRNSYYDLLKGTAILFVVAIHTYPVHSTPVPFTIDMGNFWSLLMLIARQFIVAAVPLFCTISGFFVGKKNEKECVSFAKSHALPLYIPVLIWSLPFLLYDLYKGYGNIGYDLFRYFCCGYSIHYFIAIMLQFYLFMPFLIKTSGMNQLLAAIAISFLSIGGFSYLMYVRGVDLPLFIYAGTLPVWIMFFCLGIYLSKTQRSYSLFPLIVGSFVFLLLSILESGYYINSFFQLNGIGYKVTNFGFSFFFILLMMSEKLETKSINQSINRGEVSYLVRKKFIGNILCSLSFARFCSMPCEDKLADRVRVIDTYLRWYYNVVKESSE